MKPEVRAERDQVWDNGTAEQVTLPGRYTPLVPRPEGGALVTIPPHAQHDNKRARRRTAAEKRIAKRRANILPLDQFPEHHRRHIEEAVAAPEKPERWITISPGPPGSRPLAQIESRAWYEWHWQRGIDPESRRDSIPAWLRQMVIDRDGYICQLCGGDVDPSDVHLDHIKPYSRGGQHTLRNLQVTHSQCNMQKGARE